MNQPWRSELDLSDIFHNEQYTFEEKRDLIVQRFLNLGIRSPVVAGMVESLSASFDENEFDIYWDKLYDWADSGKRLWIRTR